MTSKKGDTAVKKWGTYIRSLKYDISLKLTDIINTALEFWAASFENGALTTILLYSYKLRNGDMAQVK